MCMSDKYIHTGNPFLEERSKEIKKTSFSHTQPVHQHPTQPTTKNTLNIEGDYYNTFHKYKYWNSNEELVHYDKYCKLKCPTVFLNNNTRKEYEPPVAEYSRDFLNKYDKAMNFIANTPDIFHNYWSSNEERVRYNKYCELKQPTGVLNTIKVNKTPIDEDSDDFLDKYNKAMNFIAHTPDAFAFPNMVRGSSYDINTVEINKEISYNNKIQPIYTINPINGEIILIDNVMNPIDEEMNPIDEEMNPIVDDDEMNPIVDDDEMNPIVDEEMNPIVDDDEINPIDDDEINPIDDDEINPIDDDEINPIIIKTTSHCVIS